MNSDKKIQEIIVKKIQEIEDQIKILSVKKQLLEEIKTEIIESLETNNFNTTLTNMLRNKHRLQDTFGYKIKLTRQRLKMTQKTLANKINISQSVLSNIELNKETKCPKAVYDDLNHFILQNRHNYEQ